MLIYRWASSGDNARLFPVWVGGLTTGPRGRGHLRADRGGRVRRRDRRWHGRARRAVPDARSQRLPVRVRQGLTSDPLDKTISYTVVFIILGALPITVRTMYSRGEATVAD